MRWSCKWQYSGHSCSDDRCWPIIFWRVIDWVGCKTFFFGLERKFVCIAVIVARQSMHIEYGEVHRRGDINVRWFSIALAQSSWKIYTQLYGLQDFFFTVFSTLFHYSKALIMFCLQPNLEARGPFWSKNSYSGFCVNSSEYWWSFIEETTHSWWGT